MKIIDLREMAFGHAEYGLRSEDSKFEFRCTHPTL